MPGNCTKNIPSGVTVKFFRREMRSPILYSTFNRLIPRGLPQGESFTIPGNTGYLEKPISTGCLEMVEVKGSIDEAV